MGKLLIIDEDPLSLFVAGKLCEVHLRGHEVELVSDTKQVIERLIVGAHTMRSLPDAILTDLQSYNRESWLFLERLEMRPAPSSSPIPVHVLSVILSSADVQRLRRYPFVRSWHVKPLTKEHVRQLAEEMARPRF